MANTRRSDLDRELARLVRHAYTQAPAVKAMLDQAGLNPRDIKRVEDLERVPVTSKDKLVQLQRESPPFGGFLAANPKRLKHIYQSPGPLFEPFAGEKGPAQIVASMLKVAGFKRGEIALNTLSYHMTPGGWILDRGLQQAGVCVVPGGVGNTELQARTLIELRVAGYVGTPSFLMTLIKKAEELGVDFKAAACLRHTFFTAEPYPPSLRSQFEGDYGLRTTNAYATGELGFLAYECEEKSGLHLADNVVVEFVDSTTGKHVGPGEPGEIVVTAFNETYPILRLGTGDLAAYTDEPCKCGRPSRRMAGLLGRVGDAVKVRGMFVHPNQLKMALARFPAVVRGRGIVTRPNLRDEFRLEVEVGDPLADPAVWEEALCGAVRELCRVSVDSVALVPAGALPPDGKWMIDERKWE